MSKCLCNNPCTCYFEYDGDRPNVLYTKPYQYGRYNTRKKGSGTSADPYIVEFLDSEEFQVEAGQARTTGDISLTSATTGITVVGYTTSDYETPNEIFMAFEGHGPADGQFYPSAHKFWFVSAHATFVSNGSASGTRRLAVVWNPPADNYGPFIQISIAGSTSTGLSGAEDITLNCSGLAPFADFTEHPTFYGPGGVFLVAIQQSSGSVMLVRDVRFTIVAI